MISASTVTEVPSEPIASAQGIPSMPSETNKCVYFLVCDDWDVAGVIFSLWYISCLSIHACIYSCSYVDFYK